MQAGEMEARIVSWLEWGARTRGWAESTQMGYRGRGLHWLRWCAGEGIRPERATARDVEAWLASLHQSAAVRSHAQKALTAWFDWRKPKRRNPAREVQRTPRRRSIPRSIEREEACAVLDSAARHGPRWSCYTGLMLYSGLRRAEACQRRWVDLEGGGRWLRVLGKGSVERVLPVHDRLHTLLVAWRAAGEHPIWMFPGRYGQPMSVATANVWMRRILDGAGVTEATGHWLRHTYATELLRSGADVAEVQAALGHESLSSTTVYVRARPERVREAVLRLDYRAD